MTHGQPSPYPADGEVEPDAQARADADLADIDQRLDQARAGVHARLDTYRARGGSNDRTAARLLGKIEGLSVAALMVKDALYKDEEGE